MKPSKNPNIDIYTKTHKDRAFNLSDISLPEGISKSCVWCLDKLEGKQRRWCGDDECAKAALAWGRPQSAHGLYELLKRQDFCCKGCGLGYQEYYDLAVSKKSKFYEKELHSFDVERVMRRMKRLIPREVRPEIDHVLAITLGGTALGLENHQILCAKCHKDKTKVDIKEKFSRNPNPRKGVKFSEDHVQALSKVRKGFDSANRKKSREEKLYPSMMVPLIATNLKSGQEIEFKSLTEAADSLGLQHSNISRVLNAKQGRKKHKGWTFKFKLDKSNTVGDTGDSDPNQRSNYDQENTVQLPNDPINDDSNESEPGKPVGPIHD